MSEKYYLGLDIGTDSVGYAVTDEYYRIPKRRGEPVIGVQTFDAAAGSEERRGFRTARRRLDRRQQRVQLVNEIFAAEIGKKDPRFFIRRAESRLWRDETEDSYILFNDPDFKDKDYYEKYPTIHHLINDLMESPEPHDVRLVYLACSWLVAHRGHFLFDVASEDVSALTDFNKLYDDLRAYFAEEGSPLPWDEGITADKIKAVMTMNVGVTRKYEEFKNALYSGKKPPKDKADAENGCIFSPDAVVSLLSGKKVKPEDVFQTGAYTEVDSVSLTMAEEDFARICAEIGDDAELLFKLRAMQDCVLLIGELNGKSTISKAKIAVYEQHEKDLAGLKKFVKKYIPEEYNAIFRDAGAENYTAYSYNVKSCKEPQKVGKKASIDVFSDFLKKKIKDIAVQPEDSEFYDDMLARIETRTFMPKQKNTDNRVIPQQLYRYEMETVLANAEKYLPFLSKTDSTGLTAKEKLLRIFSFRIPYYVGPLCSYAGDNSWLVRKAEGRILPWNFEDKVDLDKSEQEFIRRMTNTCTYLAGEDVLPVKSLLYQRYTVLNEINNIKVNDNSIPVEVKQGIYSDLFEQRTRVTPKMIKDYLKGHGLIGDGDEISGIDEKINSSLSSYHGFKRMLLAGVLTEDEAERIINQAAYSEDKTRLAKWIKENFPRISNEDCKYICRLNLKEFGRLSGELLKGIYGSDKETGEAYTIIEALWSTNNNLMKLLSDKFTFTDVINERNREYYSEHPTSLSRRLEEMYVSNAVKRPIMRTLDICQDVVKAMGGAPEKIFVEMARGASDDQRNTRTVTRKQQLLNLYKVIGADARELEKELQAMGETADNRLQSDKLFLYYMQLGKCAYTGKSIDLSRLADGTMYNIEHIYPRAFVKDDSIINNKVLVDSKVNGDKKDNYPIDPDIRKRMRGTWEYWKSKGLISDEKFKRLTRATPFTEDEKWNFINRQLVETRQSTKAVAELLGEKYPEAEIVYVKAGLVSDFRKEFDMLKSRSVNNLHHAKDAYLNVVVGNVYNSRFSKLWFRPTDKYSLKVETIFSKPVKCGNATVWQGTPDLEKVKSIMAKNAIHVTKYAFCRKGGLFDQQPVKAGEGLVPLKAGLETTRYGGYNKPAASFFSLVKFTTAKKTDIMFMPVELMVADRYLKDREFAKAYAKETVEKIGGKEVLDLQLLLNNRPLKINTVLSFDGLLLSINGKSSGGAKITTSLVSPLVLNHDDETYIKAMESFSLKKATNKFILPDSEHDHITPEKNIELYDKLTAKMGNNFYSHCPGNQVATLKDGRKKFADAPVDVQMAFLLNLLVWFSSAFATIDLTLIGGAKQACVKAPSSSLSNYKKSYSEIRIVDVSPSGIFESRSENLLKLL